MSTKDRRRRRRNGRWTIPEIHDHPEAYLRSFWPAFVRPIHTGDHWGLLLDNCEVVPLGTADQLRQRGWRFPGGAAMAEGVYVLHAIRRLHQQQQQQNESRRGTRREDTA